MQDDSQNIPTEQSLADRARELVRMQGFDVRREIEQNRQMIRAYRDSQLGSTFAHRQQLIKKSREKLQVGERDAAPRDQQKPLSEVEKRETFSKPTFNEPQGRSYNPYQ